MWLPLFKHNNWSIWSNIYSPYCHSISTPVRNPAEYPSGCSPDPKPSAQRGDMLARPANRRSWGRELRCRVSSCLGTGTARRGKVRWATLEVQYGRTRHSIIAADFSQWPPWSGKLNWRNIRMLQWSWVRIRIIGDCVVIKSLESLEVNLQWIAIAFHCKNFALSKKWIHVFASLTDRQWKIVSQ